MSKANEYFELGEKEMLENLNYVAAEKYFSLALVEKCTKGFLYYNLGVCNLCNNKFKDAIIYFDLDIEMNKITQKDNKDWCYKPYFYRAQCKFQLGNFDDALEDAKIVLAKADLKVHLFKNHLYGLLAAIYSETGESGKAFEYFDLAKKNENPPLSMTYYNKALLHYKLENFDLAFTYFTIAIDIEKTTKNVRSYKFSSYYYFRGEIHRIRLNYGKALKDYNKA